MPIFFRCQHCDQLMSITRRKAGELTTCPRCGQETKVPYEEAAENSIPNDIASPPSPDIETLKEPGSIQPELTIPDDSEAQEAQPHLNANAEETQPNSPGSFDELIITSGPDEFDDEFSTFSLRRSQGDEEEMDLTPMVDVTFLLLIFFMITASFSIQKSLEVPVPNPDQQGASQTIQQLDELEEQSILVEIDDRGQFQVDAEPVGDSTQLASVISQVRSRDSKYEVVISADERTRHEFVVMAIDAAHEVGMQKIRIAVESM